MQDNIERLLLKLRITSGIIPIATYCSHVAYLAPTAGEYILVIPDTVIRLNKPGGYDAKETFTSRLRKIIDTRPVNNIRVYGGRNLITTKGMFKNCKFDAIDITQMNTSKVTNMCFMFMYTKCSEIKAAGIDTSNVVNMRRTFFMCNAKKIDISGWNTENVTRTSEMFSGAAAQELDLSSFETPNIKEIDLMFGECEARQINIENMSIDSAVDTYQMFKDCKAVVKTNDSRIQAVLERR